MPTCCEEIRPGLSKSHCSDYVFVLKTMSFISGERVPHFS